MMLVMKCHGLGTTYRRQQHLQWRQLTQTTSLPRLCGWLSPVGLSFHLHHHHRRREMVQRCNGDLFYQEARREWEIRWILRMNGTRLLRQSFQTKHTPCVLPWVAGRSCASSGCRGAFCTSQNKPGQQMRRQGAGTTSALSIKLGKYCRLLTC